MKTLLKLAALLVGVIVLVGVGVYLWAGATSNDLLSRTFQTHSVAFPVPFPLNEAELAGAGLESDEGNAVALERAVERGRHLVEARYACIECHGVDFSGGVMVDAFPIGTLLGPNLTTGRGSRTVDYTPADWDRIVRHGVRPDGTPGAMPSEDYQLMSDQELSDIIAYIRSRPAVDNEVAPVSLGPLGKFLMATGGLPLSADLVESHDRDHAPFPPASEVTVAFGRHLAGVCTGCHRADFTGGPIPAGDPSWAPARNLTPHADGLAGWGYEDFRTAMLDGERPDGTTVLAPMDLIVPYAQQMTDVELEALWLYLQSVPPLPTAQ